MHSASLTAAALAAVALATPALAQRGQVNWFDQVASYGVVGGIAEIVTASPDGNTLAFSDASAGRVGLVDITDPANPVQIPDVVTGGEPTSVSWAGNYLVAAVITNPPQVGQPFPDPSNPANAGRLFVIDMTTPATPVVLGSVAIGFQPDSVKLVARGSALFAVVCIENQPIVVDANGRVLDEDIPGFPTSGPSFPQDRSLVGAVQVVSIDVANVAASTVATVALPEATLAAAGCLFPADAQPEFVAVHGDTAAVTLQENNGIAIVDLANPAAPALVRVFSCGNAAERNADLAEDDAVSLTQGYPSSIGTTIPAPEDGSGNPVPGGPLQPDALAFNAAGTVLYTADEGELDLTGGRGFSAFALDGTRLYTDAGELEQIAVIFGQYPDGRSENRGIEVEGIATEVYGDREFLFVLSERGSFIGVYDITGGQTPRFTQFLPCGISPEGVATIASRNLLVTADEASGTLSIYRGTPRLPISPTQPLLYSFEQPFGALSGFDGAPFGIFAVPDNALPTTIYFIQPGGPFAEVFSLLPVRKNGVQARYDGEGIVRDTSILAPFRAFGGFFLASEGDGSSSPNLIVQVDVFGRVVREIQMPSNIDTGSDPAIGGNAVGSAAGGVIRSNGFEGVTLSSDGIYLYAAIQRQFTREAATHTRIARYDLRQIARGVAPNSGLRFGGDWEFFYYPLEAATGAGFIGLSEITALPDGSFLVIERDQGIGAETALKAVYRFRLDGVSADTDGQPGEASGTDVVTKRLAIDVLGEFFPFEKVEGVALVGRDVWVGLDNDGGEVANRLVNTGPLRR